MKSRFAAMSSLFVTLLWVGAATAQGPMVGIEPIIVTLPATPPGNVFEAFYPNFFDLVHPKKFTFTGTVRNGDPTAPEKLPGAGIIRRRASVATSGQAIGSRVTTAL